MISSRELPLERMNDDRTQSGLNSRLADIGEASTPLLI